MWTSLPIAVAISSIFLSVSAAKALDVKDIGTLSVFALMSSYLI